jgi:hypothetical protein
MYADSESSPGMPGGAPQMLPTKSIKNGGKTRKATRINRPVANTVLSRIIERV